MQWPYSGGTSDTVSRLYRESIKSRAWLRGQDLQLRLEVMSLSYCPTLLPRLKTQNENGPGGRS